MNNQWTNEDTNQLTGTRNMEPTELVDLSKSWGDDEETKFEGNTIMIHERPFHSEWVVHVWRWSTPEWLVVEDPYPPFKLTPVEAWACDYEAMCGFCLDQISPQSPMHTHSLQRTFSVVTTILLKLKMSPLSSKLLHPTWSTGLSKDKPWFLPFPI
jgi:hypothetical protein